MGDDDFDGDLEEADVEARSAQLGFRPQKEVIYNKLLPYSKDLDGESARWFIEIKTNLCQGFALREVRPGLTTWIGRLNMYIRFYGYKFTKEDHVSLINLLYTFVTIPDLEPWMVSKAANVLTVLLRKKELLERNDLTIQWRPLFVLYERLMYSPHEAMGMLVFAQSLENTLRALIRCSRPYFPNEATNEIMEEFRPWMCPFDVTMGKAIVYFDLFLPTFDVRTRSEHTYNIWFDELMSFWNACHNSPPWEPNLLSIFARLADQNIGEVDWEPFIPLFFTRIQKNFNLPVKYKQTMAGGKIYNMDVTVLAKWIVATLGKSSSTQKYLHQMFQSLESYYHPANFGWHSQKLFAFMSKLVHCFIRRLHRERYSKPKWGCAIRKEHTLSDEEVDAFVRTMEPIVMHAMYSKTGWVDAGATLQNLATLRPEIIIPTLVSRMENALETLTEPHKLTASMNAIVSVSRSLVYPGPKYPAGPTNVIPFLMQILPGIDPNDMRKAMVTFQFLSTFCTLVPLVDSSEAFQHHPNLTEEERIICGQTSEFEDFIVQFLDKCFAVIESSGLENTREETSASDHRANREESMKDIGMASTFSSFLVNASSSIYDVALKKIRNYISGRILETKISGKIAAGLCRCLCKIKPEKGLRVFIPEALENLSRLIKPETQKDQILDDELMFNLLILSECLRVPGNHILPYIKDIQSVLLKTLHFTSKDGYTLAISILRNVLRSITVIFPVEYKSIPEGFDRPVSEYLPIRDWGKPGNIHDLKLVWHIPSEEEIQVAQQFFDKFLGDELDTLKKFASGEISLDKDQLLNRLTIVNNIVHGSGNVLPFWRNPEKQVKLVDSQVKTEPFQILTSPREIELTLRSQNARLEVTEVMDKVQACLLKDTEDDTKSLLTVVSIYQTCLLFGGLNKEDYDTRSKSYQMIRKSLENKLVGNKRQIRALLVDRVLLQHEHRVLERNHVPLTEDHLKVFQNLLTLATSHYSHVRMKAQDCLQKCIGRFSNSYQTLIPKLTELLKKDESISHEQFKGALYVILGQSTKNMLNRHNWESIVTVWPCLIEAQHSEKPSIVKVLDHIAAQFFRGMDTFGLKLTIPDEVVAEAEKVWNCSSPLKPKESFPIPSHIASGLARHEEANQKSLQTYNDLLSKICDLVESGKLHWRHYNMAIGMFGVLTRYDLALPARVAKIIVNNLNHENIKVRKSSLHLTGCILKQQKKNHPKIEIKPVSDPSKLPSVPGDREDNLFMCYTNETVPRSSKEWDEPRFVHKTHYGYYTWPKKMMVYAPSKDQPKLDRSFEELNEVEQELFNFFNSQSNINELMKFLSLEEYKGVDKFDSRRFCMFKGLFRNFGDTFLPLFRTHMERLIEEGTESSQRCVAEILSALIRGTKHWSYDMTKNMYEWVQPLIKTALSKISVETLADWGTCFATASESRDPHRINWLIEVLMEEPIRSQGSFIDSSRLYVLQGLLAQQEWRAGQLLTDLMTFLRPYISHPYQNVRDRIGSVLTNIYLNDLEFNDKKEVCNKRSPKMRDFVKDVFPSLEILLDDSDDVTSDVLPGANGILEASPIPAAAAVSPSEKSGLPPPQMPPMMPSPQTPPVMPSPEMMLPGGDTSRMPPEKMARMQRPPMMMVRPGMQVRMPMGVPPPNARLPGFPPEMLQQLPPMGQLQGIMPPEMMAQLAAGGPLPPELTALMGGMAPLGNNKKYSPEKEEAIRLLQTVSKFLTGSALRAFNAVIPEVYELLPVLCTHESNEFEPNLAKDCILTISCLAQTIAPVKSVPMILESVKKVMKLNSWKAKTAVLHFVQVFVFNNMPSILSQPAVAEDVLALVKGSLEDERVEVREKAGAILGGLLHCEFIGSKSKNDLKAFFIQETNLKVTKVKKIEDEKDPEKKQTLLTNRSKKILRKHSGVLGLCAFVNAYPYDVPEFIPDILMVLSNHLHDPLPIPLTIKKTLQDFKRTHQDNWQDHKLKFSDDQLSVLTDLLVSPSYYA